MTIKVGDKIPSVTLHTMGPDGPKTVTTDELFKGKKVAFFGLPFEPGTFRDRCQPVDMVATLSSLLGINAPSKSVGRVLTEGLRSELLGTSVGVTVAFPGAVATNITANSGLELPPGADEKAAAFPALPAQQAARIMLNAFEQGKPRVTVGKDATTMDRLSRLNPVFAANLIYKQMKSLLQ